MVMAKKQTMSKKRGLLLSIIFGGLVILTLVVGALTAHIHTLDTRIMNLESSEASAKSELASIKRVRCETESSVTASNSTTSYTLESGGYNRTYQVHTPPSYDPSLRYPVILSFDGIDGSGDRMQHYSGLDGLNALVVYPDSLVAKQGFTAWQGAPYSLDGDLDIEFVRGILSTLPSQYCTDSSQTFAVGMSNGGSFATLAGCELGNQIRAVASVSGANYSTCSPEQRSPSLLVIHSTEDPQIPFSGSIERNLPQMPEWVDQQVEERHCETATEPTTDQDTTFYTWLDCDDTSMVRFVVVHNQPHGWVSIPQTTPSVKNTADYIWKFFEDSVYYKYE